MKRSEDPDTTYSDDPPSFGKKRRHKSLGIFSVTVLIVASLIFVKSTLGANITINGGKTEFGQGIGGIKTCVNSNNLAVKQQTAFSSGSFKLKTITIGNIPLACHGYDFIISILKPGAEGSSTLATLYGSISKLIIYDKDGSYYVAAADGSYVTLNSSTDGTVETLVITFTSPQVLNSDIGILGIETSENSLTNLACGGGGDCPIGGTGPGGGIVIFNGPISAPGSPCDLACNGLEIDTTIGANYSDYWLANAADSPISGTAIGMTYHGMGNGYRNTALAIASNGGAGSNTQRKGAMSYCWNKTTATANDRWYVPDVMEYAYIFYQVKQNAAFRTAASNFPAITDYLTSEEGYGTFNTTYVTDRWNGDSPPPGVSSSYQKVFNPTTASDHFLAVAPLVNDSPMGTGTNPSATYANYNYLRIYDHQKTAGYAIICLHAFK